MIQPFIDTLYSIAIGLGFNDFPGNPLKNRPAILFFFFTLTLAAMDWYYYRSFEQSVPEGRRFLYYSLQIVTVLVLSQMFRHSHGESVQSWLAYFIVLNILGIAWDILAGVRNVAAFASINILFIVFSAFALIKYAKLSSAPPFGVDVRYSVFVGEIVVALIAMPILHTCNK